MMANIVFLEDGRVPIEFRGKRYNLYFSLNALDALQKKFGSITTLDKIFNQESKTLFEDMRWLLALLANEGRDDGEPEIPEREIGSMVNTRNLTHIQEAMFEAFAAGSGADDGEEGATDNRDGGDQEDSEVGEVDPLPVTTGILTSPNI
jgi:hypothetical protein